MIDAIQHQTAPFDNDVYEPIAGVIHVASWRARAQELSMGSEGLINTYPDPVGVALGIDPDIIIGEDIPSLTTRKRGSRGRLSRPPDAQRRACPLRRQSGAMQALRLYAGPAARRHIEQHGLRPARRGRHPRRCGWSQGLDPGPSRPFRCLVSG